MKYNVFEQNAFDRNEIPAVQSKTKIPKIFISHSSKDQEYVKAIVDLLSRIGVNDNQIFCSSVPGYGIPINQDILDYLREQFKSCDLHVIIVHSPNYYKSTVSMNEMGAAWVLQTECTSILLPGFEYSQMTGAVNNSKIAIKLDGNELELKDKLNQLMEIVVEEFGLQKTSSILWEQRRNEFIQRVHAIPVATPTIEMTKEAKIKQLEANLSQSQAEVRRYKRLFIKACTGTDDNEVDEEYQALELAESMRLQHAGDFDD